MNALSLRRLVVLGAATGALGLAVFACDLNPQPLPPIIEDGKRGGAAADDPSGGFGQESPNSPAPSVSDAGSSYDAGTSTVEGDAGDASTDASPDAG